jgi:hypothetical protein
MITLILYVNAIFQFALGAFFPEYLNNAMIIGSIWVVGGILSQQRN